MTISEQYASITSIARCTYEGVDGQAATDVMVRGEMSVSPSGKTDVCSGTGYCGMSAVTSPFDASTSYTTTGKFYASQWSMEFSSKTVSASVTTPSPQRPHDEPVDPVARNAPTCGDPGQCSPIVLNLGSGGYALTSLEDGVRFDIRASGVAIRTAWTEAGAQIGFLALDRDGNGRVDSALELFGDRTRLADGSFAANGFEALAEFDRNGDRVIDGRDLVWSQLLVWVDANHDGRSDAGEVHTIRGTAVSSIALEHRWTGRVDRYGNAFAYRGTMVVAGTPRPFYDVWFVTER